MTGRSASRLLSRPKRCAAVLSAICGPIMMGAHHRSRSLGVLFANNKPDAARRATSDDDAVLISGEPEARDIGGRDRIAEDFVISHYMMVPPGLLEQHDESARQDGQDGHPHQREPDE